MPAENITNGSDTGNPASWLSLVTEAVGCTEDVFDMDTMLDLKKLVNLPLHAGFESVLGLGLNPFLKASPLGKMVAPDGSAFDLSVSEACFKWVNIRCQAGSVADGWGVLKTDTTNDADFACELTACAAALKASGPALFALFAYLSSGTKLKDIFLRFITDDDDFYALSCWKKWVGTDPSNLPAKRKAEAIADIKLWTAVWQKAAEEAVKEFGPLIGEQAVDIAKAISRYGALMKRTKSNAQLDVTLIDEAKAFLTLKANGIIIPWSQRNATRNHLAKLHYGNLIVSFLPRVRAAEDVTSWDQELLQIRNILSDFEGVTEGNAKIPQVSSASAHPHKPNKLQLRQSKDSRYLHKLGGKDPGPSAPAVSEAKATAGTTIQAVSNKPLQNSRPTVGCYNCGSADHMIRDCPNPRRSARVAKQHPEQKRLGMMGVVDSEKEEEYEESVYSSEEDDYETPESNGEDVDDNEKLPEVQGQLGMFAPEVSTANSNVRSVSLNLKGKSIRFGLDGGLDVSLISKRAMEKLDLDTARLRPCNIILSGLGGSLRITKLVECEFNFGTHFCGLVESLPGGFDGLLGIDLLDHVNVPAIVDFKKAYDRLQERLESGKDPEVQTWRPMFHYIEGPLSQSDLRACVEELKLPVMNCEFDSPFPIIREKGRPTPFVWREKVDEIVRNLEKQGILKEVDSNSFGWVSPAVFIPKRGTDDDVKLRFVVDYSSVNQRVVKATIATYPHNSNAFLSDVRRDARYFAKIDIANAFWNLPISDKIRPFLRTSVVTSKGERLFEWLKGPQGFTSTPLWWINFIEEVLRALNKCLRPKVSRYGIRAFMDDLLIYAHDKTACDMVFLAVKQFLTCLGIPFGKLVEPCESVEIIGLTFTNQGVYVSETASFKDLKVPRDKTELRSAVGVFQFIRNGFEAKSFVRNMGILSALLRKSVQFKWTETEQEAWDYFASGYDKNIFHYFSDREQLEDHECFLLQTDASDFGISSVLWICDSFPPDSPTSDWFANHARVVATKGRVYSREESSYPMWDKEGLALFEGLATHQEKLLLACNRPGQFLVYSDSSGAIQRFRKVLNGGKQDDTCASSSRARRWKRWVDDLAIIFLLGPKFCHIPGEFNSVADYFSRALLQVDGRDSNGLALAGSASTEHLGPFDSDLLMVLRELQSSEGNTDLYEGRLIRELVSEPSGSFQMIDGLLYFCPGPDSSPRLYIPPGKARLGENLVDIKTALTALAHQAHEGVNRTNFNLKSYYWPKQSQTVRNFVSSCLHCQKKNIRKNFGRLTGRSIPHRFDRIIVDHASPSSVGNNKSGQSYRHVLVVCDSFSRYIELFPVHTTSVEETCECLIKWCLRHGFPRELVADNASSLKHRLINVALSLTSQPSPDLIRWIAPVHYPESQGEAERTVRELKSYLKIRNDSSWPNLLPFLAFAHNSASYGSTHLSPHLIVFGTEPTKLVDLLSWPLAEEGPSTAEEFTENLKNSIKEYHDFYRMKMEEYRTLARDYYNEKHVGVDYTIGDKVWVIRKVGFKTEVDGPAEIIAVRGDHMYDVKLDEDDNRFLPIQHLSPFVDPNLCAREGIPFAGVADEEISQELVKKDPRRLTQGDMVLLQREGSTDMIDYDLGRVLENIPQVESLKVELLTLRDNNSQQWSSSGLQFTYPYRRIFASGFTLTRNSEIRRSTQRHWHAAGILI